VATRRRTSSTRRTTRRRGTRSRTTRRGTGTTYRRRRPKLATTLGSAAALALIAAFVRWSLLGRVVLVAAMVALLVAWFLWSRRGDISDEMQARGIRPEDEPATGDQTPRPTQEEPT
jgi:Flp pilus assembly protein TadB